MKGGKGKGALRKETRSALKPVEDPKMGKRKATLKDDKKKVKKDKKAKKDPNKPKRPPSAFFVFLEEFRKTFKKENPNVKAVSAVGKAGGEKWKSMSAAEKAPYEAKAAKRKVEYGKLMNAYNKKQPESSDDEGEEEEDEEEEEKERPKPEVHDEDVEDSGKGEEDEDDDDDEEDEDEEDD
ncbi:HMG1/2-like protein [Capsicum annuum]|uniref:HMG1/2-like protein n=1 Tax=Capsicum annuum TaxID=4072 RepID=A0A1U8E473_CAPAN|nr:high mobility group B protein 1 isoform X2 [Capsicum annuum]XP_047252952.1 high mobility group B protein 1 isoform X2 [Capsicum annuum]KAF3659682.1 HMG1/2-like protein [Capsicum annuum]PHT72640.1 HMG1/2-like protein [Capsicum annuum]